MVSNIAHTDQGTWSYGSLSFAYNEPSRGPLNAPASWPVYRIAPAVQVRTGDKVPRTGIYLPDVGGSHWLPETGQAALRLKCDAGQPCPRTGWWFTPAKAHSRRHFKTGEVMPDFPSDWGQVIWQWDERQGD